MLFIADQPLSAEASSFLDRLQSTVDSKNGHEEQVSAAKQLFNARHRAYRRHFLPIVQLLSDMAPPFRRCYYCEDSEHRDIEHIKPKRHYPELCFRWINYAYACTICNGAKSDTVALFVGPGDATQSFSRTYPAGQRLPDAPPVLIDPRTEDPMDYMKLDLLTGNLAPIAASGRAHLRAKHTIDLLRLNRDGVARTRRSMIQSYLNYLKIYKDLRDQGDSKCVRVLAEIYRLPQPTIFAELRRQKNDHEGLSEMIDILPPAE